MTKMTLSIPEGYKIDLNKSNLEKGEVYFEKIDTNAYTLEEIYKKEEDLDGYYLDMDGVNEGNLGTEANSTDCRTEKEALKILAYISLVRIASYYNEYYAEGWVPDWEKAQNKYYVYHDKNKNKFKIDSCMYLNRSSVYFATELLAQKALDSNPEIFEALYL